MESLADRLMKLETAILVAHTKALPPSWVYTDADTTLDLLVAEITTLRSEQEELRRNSLHSERSQRETPLNDAPSHQIVQNKEE